MFYDERINFECGKIYQRGILLATVVALLYGGLRAGYLAVIGMLSVKYLFTELFIVLFGIAVLSIGAVRFRKNGDERTLFEKHRYYLNAGKIFLLVALSGYALTIPFAMGKRFYDMPANELILILEVLGYIYFFYSFKSKKIDFNYSFIAENKRTYYGRVFANIGKMAGLLAVVFFFSEMIDVVIHQSFLSAWSIVLGYLYSVVGLGAEYLFLSWVEKLSYEEETPEKLKKGTVIVGIAVLLFTVCFSAADIWYYTIATGNLHHFSAEVGETLSSVSSIRHSIGYIVTVVTAMWLCYFRTQAEKSKLVKRSIGGYLAVTAASVVYDILNLFFVTCVFHISDDGVLLNLFADISKGVTYLFALASFACLLFFIYGSIRDMKVSRTIVLLPVLRVVSFGCTLFLQSQSLLMGSCIVESVLTLISVVVGLLVLKSHSYREEEERTL